MRDAARDAFRRPKAPTDARWDGAAELDQRCAVVAPEHVLPRQRQIAPFGRDGGLVRAEGLPAEERGYILLGTGG